MAVFYKGIKGCKSGSQINSGSWSYVSWGTYNSSSADVNGLPVLKLSNKRQDGQDGTEQDYGYFLTNKAQGVQINSRGTFTKGNCIFIQNNNDIVNAAAIIGGTNKEACVDFVGNLAVIAKQDGGVDVSGSGAQGNIYVQGGAIIEKLTELKNDVYIRPEYSNNSLSQAVAYFSKSNTYLYPVYSNSSVSKSALQINSSDTGLNTRLVVTSSAEGAFKVNGRAGITGECKAEYFNATSDKRAKENIELSTYSALELISKLPIYNYNYKSNPGERVTGILAQDLLAAQPAELDLVSNKEATGEDGDYMSIKTDKITFVLMKAIQELQEEIIKLKDEIQQLKN